MDLHTSLFPHRPLVPNTLIRCFVGLGLVAAQEEPWPQQAQLCLGPTSGHLGRGHSTGLYCPEVGDVDSREAAWRHGALRAGNDSVSSAFL